MAVSDSPEYLQGVMDAYEEIYLKLTDDCHGGRTEAYEHTLFYLERHLEEKYND